MADIKFPRQCFDIIIDNHTNFDDARLCAYITVTQNFLVYSVSCFHCDAIFALRDWEDFTLHINREHRSEVKTFFELGIFDEKMKSSYKEEAEISASDDEEFVEAMQKSSSAVEKTTEELMDFYGHEDPLNLEKFQDDKRIIDVKTSDTSLVFKLIDSLEAYPALWFINTYNTKEHKVLLLKHLTEFSKKLELELKEDEVLETLAKLHVWFKNIHDKRSFRTLTYPHSEFYRRCLEFLPDQENGKTCDLCEEMYEDHFQYFAHKRTKHMQLLEVEKEHETEQVVASFIANADDYLRMRYPRYVAFSYKCKVCQWNYAKKQGFVEHIKTHLSIAEHVCDLCGKTFAKNRTYVKHRKRHAGLHRVQCKICGKDFDNFSLLTAHRKRYHTVVEGTIEEIEAAAKKAMPMKNLLKAKKTERYFYWVESTENFACSICRKSYKFKSGAYYHYKRNHL